MTKILKIARLELSILFYSPVAWLVLAIFMVQAGTGFFGMLSSFQELFMMGEKADNLTRMLFPGINGLFDKVLQTLYLYIPLLTMGLISRELSSGSIKLLLSSPVKITEIILGKYLTMLYYALMLIAILGIYSLIGVVIKDSLLYKSMMDRSRARYYNRANDPGAAFNDTISAVLGNYNFRRTGPSLKKLDMVNLDRVFSIYKERFANAANMAFVFTGNIDVKAAKPLFEKYLGSLPSTSTTEKPRDLVIDPPVGKISKTIIKGKEAKATVVMVYSGKYDFNNQNNIVFDALQENLNIRLIETLRERDGSVYSPRVDFNLVKEPAQRFSLTIQFGCDPANAEKLIASAQEEVRRLSAEGPQEENIAKWKAEWRRQRELDLRENGWWLNYIIRQLQSVADVKECNEDAKIVDAVDTSAVKKAAKQYLLNGNLIKFTLMPEAH
ncbi:hypothetical protein EOD41_11930 [Mucilaginibacter limnophilus]|uniref:Peptidase M16 C-terminal domain-containing protein n=1 Tax=Mucilaginibacter limnophilus TaxID=1932778 RepID=A0A3S3TGT6_9SPHI|nr:insulinase family protein [Mucilaginibacter limnophilus]RVU00698.1 hypothetical protein EOD41_11930 [Mucilaginibacter limnophilus]